MPVDWEGRYQQGDMPWDKGAPSPGLSDYLAAHGPLRGRILVPGCGLGYDVRAISRADNETLGLDVAPSAIRLANTFPKAGRETYLLADLLNPPAGLPAGFDWVWEHTCFCAIDRARRPDYARAVASALKPGGHLLAVFYLDPGEEDGLPPFGATLAELDALFSPAFTLEREWMPQRTYPGREGREWMQLLRRRA